MMKTKQSLIKRSLIASIPFLACFAHAESENLVYSMQGTIPVLITAPHGGNDQPGSVPIRTGVDSNGVTIEDFNIVKDSWTKAIAKEIQRKYQEKYGGVPYIVAADFHRKYIDANRPEHQAFESEQGGAAEIVHCRLWVSACRWSVGRVVPIFIFFLHVTQHG